MSQPDEEKHVPSSSLKGGPNSSEGKAISCRNSTSHGLGCRNFLCCKKEKCYYFDCCRLRQLDNVDMAAIKYNSICIQEYTEYEELVTKLSLKYCAENKQVSALIEEYALTCIRSDRINKYISIVVEPSDWVYTLKSQLTFQKIGLIKKLRDTVNDST